MKAAIVKRGKFREFLLIAWMISAFADCLIYLPVLHRKLQLFEIFFCFFLLTSIRSLIVSLKSPFPLKWPLLAFAALAVLNALFHPESPVILENLGTLYVCIIPLIFSHALLNTGNPKKVIEKGMLGGGVLLLFSAATGLLLYYMGWSANMVKVYDNYPYLDTVVRVIGWTNSPNKLAAFAAVGIYFLLYMPTRLSNKIKVLFIMGLILTALLTFSKEFVILPFVPLLLYLFQKRSLRGFSYIVLAGFIMGIVGLTYGYLSLDEKAPAREDIIDTRPIARFSSVSVYPTSYYHLFRSSWRMIRENPVTGVGFGQYQQTVEAYKQSGFYPKALYAYEAHDNYAGLAAQYGLGYFFVLGWLIIALRRIWRQLPVPESRLVAAVLWYFLLFGFIYHSYHLRLMWMFFGVVQFYLQQAKHPEVATKTGLY